MRIGLWPYMFLPVFAFFSLTVGFAQREGNVWYFGGSGYGLDFNQSPPIPLLNGARLKLGQVSAMSGSCGNLLFYSDGDAVYGNDHKPIANGTDMSGLAIQPAVAVPHPAGNNLYFLFTLNDGTGPRTFRRGLYYSIVDMTRNSGRGEVTEKNVYLGDVNTSQMTAVRHANLRDFWLLVPQGDSRRLLAYAITGTGVQPVPVVSVIPYTFIPLRSMRASPDGRKLAVNPMTGTLSENVILYFDNAAGRVTGAAMLPAVDGKSGGDMEFSPDSQKVYWTFSASTSTTQSIGVAQYQLDKPDSDDIAATRYPIPATLTLSIGSLRLAPDGKIYASGGQVDAIENPNAVGPALVYRRNVFPNIFPTGGGYWTNNIAGITVGKRLDFSADTACTGTAVPFAARASYRVQRWQWDFGDAGSGTANRSEVESPVHVFSGPGRYRVRLVTLDLCGEYDTAAREVAVYAPPAVQFTQDTLTVCYQQAPVPLTVPPQFGTAYRWNTGDTAAAIRAVRSGWYSLVAANPCGTARDSLYVRIQSEAVAYLPDDTVVCEGNFAVLDAQNPGSSYRWNTGQTTRTIETDRPGKYWVQITGACNTAVDTARLVFIREDAGAFVPNVFSPDGDGINDTFEHYVLSTPVYRLLIVNRWGHEMFSSDDPAMQWDGRTNGQEAPTGLYYYLITGTDCRGRPARFKGTLTLLRWGGP